MQRCHTNYGPQLVVCAHIKFESFVGINKAFRLGELSNVPKRYSVNYLLSLINKRLAPCLSPTYSDLNVVGLACHRARIYCNIVISGIDCMRSRDIKRVSYDSIITLVTCTA